MAGTTTSNRWLLGVLAVAAIAASAFFLLHQPTEKAEQLATNASKALGLRAAEEVARLIGHRGQVALLELELAPGQAPTEAASIAMFRKTLRKHGISVARSHALPGGLSALVMGRTISRDDYARLAEGPPAVDAVVTFAGLPNCPLEELSKLQSGHAPLVVVDLFGQLRGPLLPGLVDQKTVALAFSPRSELEVQQLGNEPRLFERYYKIIQPGPK